MIVKPYDARYEDDVRVLIEIFHEKAAKLVVGALEPQTILELIRTAEKENAFVLTDGQRAWGVFYGQKVNLPTLSRTAFQEVFFYVDEQARSHAVKFIKEVEKQLKSRGIDIMIMTVLASYKHEPLVKFYELLGYERLETHLWRTL